MAWRIAWNDYGMYKLNYLNMDKIIQTIIDARNNKATQIQSRLNFLVQLKVEIENFENLRNSIVDSQGNLREDSQFYTMLQSNPETVRKIFNASAKGLSTKIDTQIQKLRMLVQRFERKYISILVYGYAHSGKSTFIGKVSGLPNSVVPAFGGSHCTGASSFVHNSDNFKAKIYVKSEEQVVKEFNTIVSTIQKNKGISEVVTIKQLSDLKSKRDSKEPITPKYFHVEEKDGTSYSDVLDYITNISVIDNTLHHPQMLTDEVTKEPYFEIVKKDEVMQYVAQHNENSTVKFSAYKAVKYVRLFHPFNVPNTKQIVLNDNIGFGDYSITNDRVNENMYKFISESCDVILYLIRVDGWRAQSGSDEKMMNNIRYEDDGLSKERLGVGSKNLFIVLNRETSNPKDEQEFKDCRNWYKDTCHRQETILGGDLSNLTEVNNLVMTPLLKQIVDNLSDIDKKSVEQVETDGEELYNSYKELLNKISAVLVSSPEIDSPHYFNKLFKELFDFSVKNAMYDTVNEVKKEKDNPSEELDKKLAKLTNDESKNIYLDEISSIVSDGIRYNEPFNEIFRKSAAALRHNIPNHFRTIDTELKDNVEKPKAKVFSVLMKEGRLTRICKIKEEVDGLDTKKKSEAIVSWTNKLLTGVIKEEEFPTLYKTIKDLYDFKIVIEGFLLYRIVKHLSSITEFRMQEPEEKENVPKAIRYYLKERLIPAIGDIKKELKDFTTAPNEAIYFSIEEYYVSLCLLDLCRDDLLKLYFKYRHSIWQEEYEGIQSSILAFEEWKNMRDKLNSHNVESNFNKLLN